MQSFINFVKGFARSPLAPSAQYWVGNAHYALKDYRSAIASQRQLMTTYPDSQKVPDAMLNISSSQIELGDTVGAKRTLDELEAEGRVIAYYVGNPNGSMRDIAGITNERGNVVGIMPHPEHAVEALTGPGTDGLGFFSSVLSSLVAAQ